MIHPRIHPPTTRYDKILVDINYCESCVQNVLVVQLDLRQLLSCAIFIICAFEFPQNKALLQFCIMVTSSL